MIKRMIELWSKIFPEWRRVDLQLMSYSEANKLLAESENSTEIWRVAKEEDSNYLIGTVWLEKIVRVS